MAENYLDLKFNVGGEALQRTAGDFSTFDEKVAADTTDVLLLEDSADGGAKKSITVASLLGGGNGFTETLVLASDWEISHWDLIDVPGMSVTLPSAGIFRVRIRGVVNATNSSTQAWTINFSGTFSSLQQSFFSGNGSGTLATGASVLNNSSTDMSPVQAPGRRPLDFSAVIFATSGGSLAFRTQRSVAAVTILAGMVMEVDQLWLAL